jgi:hypothetical protein
MEMEGRRVKARLCVDQQQALLYDGCGHFDCGLWTVVEAPNLGYLARSLGKPVQLLLLFLD